MNNILLIKYISIEDWDWGQSPIPKINSQLIISQIITF